VGPTHTQLGLREFLGRLVGAAWALPVAAISAARHARMFHPRGVLLEGRVFPYASVAADPIAQRISGHALVRLSGALSKRDAERNEVLGLALRISTQPFVGPEPRIGDQDLLFATILSPVTMPIAPFLTRSDDFVENHYYAVGPFEIEGAGRVKLRISPIVRAERHVGNRRERLMRAMRENRAIFVVEMRETFGLRWDPVAKLVLERPSPIDQEALRFDPFRAGRDIHPVGFVHAIRKYVYAASQLARPVRAA
jgi:hypothetical protein